MTRRVAPVGAIAQAMKRRGWSADECLEHFHVPEIRDEILALEELLPLRRSTPTANAGRRKEIFLDSVRRKPARWWLPFGPSLRGAIATVAVVATGTLVASAADPVAVVEDIGREIGISGGAGDESAPTFRIEGVVRRVDHERGLLVIDEQDDQREVSVSAETAVVGAAGFDQIRPGMTVLVLGTVVDGRYEAQHIQILEGSDSDTEGQEAEPTRETEGGQATPEAEPDPVDGGDELPDPAAGADAPLVPVPTPTTVPDPPIPLPLLPDLPIEPPEPPDNPVPDLPLPDPSLPPLPPILP